MLGFLYILRYRDLTKIGIANANLENRYRGIDRTTKGKQRLAFALLLYNPRRVEAWLHRKYARHRTRLQGSGGTEWFRLSLVHRAGLYLLLLVIQVQHFAVGCLLGYMVLWAALNAEFILNLFQKIFNFAA